jgi:GNAT superfamily N-acetyltransferase
MTRRDETRGAARRAADVVIRRASPADAGAIAALAEQYWAFEGLDGFDRGRVAALLAQALADPARAAAWLAEAGGVPVGYLLAVLLFSLEHGGTMAEIDELFVVPAARGAGAGVALVRAAEEALRRLGVHRLQLQLGVANERGRAFYRRAGFSARASFELWDKAL